MTFEELLNKAKYGAEKVGQKASDLYEVTRLKMAISDVEKEIKENYEGLGRLLYDGRKSGEDIEEMIASCIANIDDLQQEVAILRDQVCDFKNVRKCAECGAVNPIDADFCNKCGAPLVSAWTEVANDATEISEDDAE